MKRINIFIAVFAVVLMEVSFAKAEGFSVDFDKGSFRSADFTEAVNMSSVNPVGETAPQNVYFEFEAAQLPGGSRKNHKSILAATIKDILFESSNAGKSADVYLSLNSSGKIVVERDGVVVRVLNNPAAALELSGRLSNRKDTIEESWEEETESLSADGIGKKICRFFFERICRWISCPAGQPVNDYNDCVQECKIRITPLGCRATN